MYQPIVEQDAGFIGGEWRRRGAPILSLFPADGAFNGRLSAASPRDVDRAIERASYLYRIADGVAPNVERMSCVPSRDTGKTAAKTRARGLSGAGTCRSVATLLATMEDALTPCRDSYLSVATKDGGATREKGTEGIGAWMWQKSLYFDLSDQPHPFVRAGGG